MKNSYRPIDCNLYDIYVHHAMRKTKFSLALNDHQVFIKDVFTSNGEEFLLLSNGNQYRLDKIHIEGETLIVNY